MIDASKGFKKEGLKMLSQLAKLIRRKLLKINWLRREVEAYQLRQGARKWHEDWARKMSSSGTIRQGK